MSRRLTVVLCTAIAAIGLFLVGPPGAHADDADAAGELLDRSREAVYDHEFEGTVVVEWSEGGRQRRRTVAIEVGDGVIRMGDDRLVSAGTRRLLRTDAGWQVLWAGGATGSAPDPSAKYRFVVAKSGSGLVARRPATEVTITRSGSEEPRERLFFDHATGMLLRRDQLDERGRVVRRFAVLSMTEPRPVDASGPGDMPSSGGKSTGAPRVVKDMPDGLESPKRIGRGYVLTGAYSQPDGSVQLYYSDGLIGVSVFERAGELDWDSLPEGGRTVELGDIRSKVYATAAGNAVVWDHGDVTFTCVTDAPLDDVASFAANLSGSDDSSVLEDVSRFVTAPFSWG